MTTKFGASRRRAFLTALAQTGNQALSCEKAKVSRSWVTLHRSTEPEFDAACRDAIAEARRSFDRLRTSGEGVRRPEGKWAYLAGEELVVRSTGGAPAATPELARGRGRPQIARARLHGWSPRVEERFLGALTAMCNVKAACAEVGLTPASAYGHRLRWPAFARAWDAAVTLGYDRIECALIEAGCDLFSPEQPDDLPPIRGMTFDHAIHLLHMHKHAARGLGKRPGLPPREVDIEELRAELIRRLAIYQRKAALGAERCSLAP